LSINWPKVLLLLRYSALRRSSNSDRLFLVLRRIAVGNLIRFALEKPEEVSAHSGFLKCQVIGECISCARAPRILVGRFGDTLATGQHHPWESLQKHLELVLYREFTPDALTGGRATVSVGKPKRVVSKRVTTLGYQPNDAELSTRQEER